MEKNHQDVVLFDINETVLDLSPLKPKFRQYLGHEYHMNTWFAMLLHSSTVCLATQVKTDFKTLSKTAFMALAGRLDVTLSQADSDDLLATFACLPAHSDISPALNRLKQAGFGVVALSNSSLSLLDAQLTHAGVIELFDEVISVESAATFKPSADAYLFAAKQLNRAPAQLRLVATHDWDTHGALTAGLKAAYINRTGGIYHPLYQCPDIVADTMADVVDEIIRLA